MPTLHFRVAFSTVWGESIAISGSEAALGNWDLSQAIKMTCHHSNDVLVWEARVPVPSLAAYSYKYVLLHEGESGPKLETDIRTVQLPSGLGSADVVDIHDQWKVSFCISSI